MNQKTKKIIWQLITLIGLVVLYYFVEKNEKNYPREADKTDEQAIVSVQTQANLPPETLLKSAVSVDYDTNMANDKFGQHNAPVDYYMLALSWSPAFCESMREANQGNVPQRLQYQCVGDNFGWVIHGLWPQIKMQNALKIIRAFAKGIYHQCQVRLFNSICLKPQVQPYYKENGKSMVLVLLMMQKAILKSSASYFIV